MNKICEHCKRVFLYKTGWNSPGRFCSRPCLYESMRTIPTTKCLTCKNEIRKKKYCSKKCYYISLKGKVPTNPWVKGQVAWNKGLKGLSDEKHHAWKGDKVGLIALHQWVGRKWGYPNKCEFCGFSSNNRHHIQWSNVSRTYKRDRDDWQRLCQSCHGKYDRKMKRLAVDATGY